MLASLPAALVQAGILRLLPSAWWWIPVSWHKTMARVVGVRTQIRGTPLPGPALFVSNHISWLDILVIGGHIRGSFIAKHEVEGWGVFGVLARLHRTVFIDRARRAASLEQRDEIVNRLKAGDNLILFAEGTSTDGTMVKPFKSALFSVAQTLPDLPIQPVTIAYTHLNGMPITRSQRPLIGWFGDMELTGHVWNLLTLGRITAVLQFHEPMSMSDAGSRKALAADAHDAVSAGLAKANSGRLETAGA